MSNKALEGRHWAQIFQILGQPYIEGDFFAVEDLIRLVQSSSRYVAFLGLPCLARHLSICLVLV